jgi:hypothetical protein
MIYYGNQNPIPIHLPMSLLQRKYKFPIKLLFIIDYIDYDETGTNLLHNSSLYTIFIHDEQSKNGLMRVGW